MFNHCDNNEKQKLCIVCKSLMKYQKGFKLHNQYDRFYKLLICPHCQLRMLYPFPENDQIIKMYSSEIYRDHQSRFIWPIEILIKIFRMSRYKTIAQFKKKGRILDIGCGRGFFLFTMKQNGWMAFGLELNDETAWYGEKVLGLNIIKGNLIDAQFDSSFFDVITIWHVLEHLPDPNLILKECKRILKPGGILVIAIPNIDSIQAKISGKYWFHLDLPYHLYHFNTKNIEQLLKNYSFKIIKVKHFSLEYNPFGYLQSFINMIHIEHNLLYNILKSRSIRRSLFLKNQDLKLYFHICISILLVPLFLPLSLCLSFTESLLKRGGTIEIYAIKEGNE